ncbi:MAG: STM3941 family protein [Bacteroidota bacterium]
MLWTQVALLGLGVIVSLFVMLNLELIMHKWLRLTGLIMGFLGVTAFAYGLTYAIMRARSTQPILEAREDDLIFNASILNHGSIDWNNIDSYGLVKYAGRKMMLINLKNSTQFLSKYKGLQGRHLRLKNKRFGTPVAIPANLVPGDVVEVMKDLSAFGTV